MSKCKVVYANLVGFDVVRTSTNFNPSQQILNPGSKVSFTNGIDDRITQRTGAKDSIGDK